MPWLPFSPYARSPGIQKRYLAPTGIIATPSVQPAITWPRPNSAGWTEGLQLMPVGSKYRFWIPSELAYGSKGTPGGPIGPDAALTFDVELLGVQ